MVILGIGSNLGDRLAYLRQALQLIKKIPGFAVKKVSPIYISDALLPENAPISWDTPYLNVALIGETQLTPHDLLPLLKDIELLIERKPEKHWGPRVIDIDILAWDNLSLNDDKLHIPHTGLLERPFALWPLADLIPTWVHPGQHKTAAEIAATWGSRFTGLAPLHTQQLLQRMTSSQLVGILNITPDSFSDAGKYTTTDAIIQQAHHLVNNGAEILDVGAEATGPTAIPLNPYEEWQRLAPVLQALLAERSRFLIPPKISLDTRHVAVAKKALALGVDWINDVSGLSDPAMCRLIAEQGCDVVLMHQLGIPANSHKVLPLDQDPVFMVHTWATQRLVELEKFGISRDKIIFDVGIGFGKTAEQSLQLLQNIDKFKNLATRLLVGHSRKSFLTLFTHQPPAERDIETIAAALSLSHKQIDYLRVHNVEMTARAIKVAESLLPENQH